MNKYYCGTEIKNIHKGLYPVGYLSFLAGEPDPRSNIYNFVKSFEV